MTEKRTFEVRSISFRRILNSHVQFTNEFIIETTEGSVGVGAAPQGETISIYEDKECTIEPQQIIDKLKEDKIISRPIDQEGFDGYLEENIEYFGRNNSYALSLAFFNATNDESTYFEFFGRDPGKLEPPILCMNILNGGFHAYTNPVLSDFHEYLVVARKNDISEMIMDHEAIQMEVRRRLRDKETTVVSDNPVHMFENRDNRECIEFLLEILSDLGLDGKYDLMIDASGGDLWTGTGYRLEVTDDIERSREEFIEYWLEIISNYGLGILEDPFHEEDYESWKELVSSQSTCKVVGDNFYSSTAERIEEGARNGYTHGALVKPNQAGTVSATVRAVRTAQKNDQIVITSHRSISTESTTFLPLLTCMCDVRYIKIGPLYTDYSSVIRLNEFIRLTER